MAPAASPTPAGSRAATFVVVPEDSSVSITSQTNVHPIHGVGSGFEGMFEIAFSGGALDLTTAPAGWVEIDIERLRSGNRTYDTEMKRLVSRQNPKIRGEISAVEPVSVSEHRYRVTGTLAFHGAAREVTGEVVVTPGQGGLVTIEGEHTFNVLDFGMDPPRMRALEVEPTVHVKISLSLKPKS